MEFKGITGRKSINEYEWGILLRFVLILPTKIWKDGRIYAKIGAKGKCMETLIKPRKIKDMQG